jgi:uncharacterized protein YecE (DUF72 family)
MQWIGTSGYNYPEWKGTFYPPTLAASKMLPYYAARFATVEINYTFYRIPTEKLVTGWAAQVPEAFKFTLKAPKRITHEKKLKDCGDLVRGFCDVAATLGPRLGALLFQLPPFFKRDLATLDEFLATLPPKVVATFEFRHDSWHDEEVYARLRDRNIALCIADTGERSTPLVPTADYGYFRLRDEGYQQADIERWADTMVERAAGWRETFIYFKHEDEGKGPDFANRLIDALATRMPREQIASPGSGTGSGPGGASGSLFPAEP